MQGDQYAVPGALDVDLEDDAIREAHRMATCDERVLRSFTGAAAVGNHAEPGLKQKMAQDCR
jgi:hypothetical protein